MAITVPYLGLNRLVAEVPEEDWGEETTAYLVALLQSGDVMEFKSVALNILRREIVGADLVIAVAGTITWTANHHIVSGDSAAVTVDATTGIAVGETDKQVLTLEGGDATNTVQLDHAGNVNLNGAVVLGLGHKIRLEWSVVDTEWVELNRSH